ncbi:cutinase [Mycobacterium haemophilum DSM 44634]|uniref:Cutinase n=1 Tax=Mycobacterium haemophilum TaxID=29311 RepID=A0A0I9U1A5_9MYCO|nr:cutinase [Mycobacterium haemophilum DSM 44634]KLO26336.1 cutinase [Mycobacterium haemophilum]KLO34595.1 cutinase [Mycobacterium haemophilum]KLO40956.1 cutinase [Mycobacterium haemophilum]KLO46526.1 cutinase [Mycobacterium haemophilum]
MAVAVGVAAVAASWALLGVPVPAATADPCPDIDVVFARGTGEPPGIGSVGGPFVDALRSQVGSKSIGVYPVNYPASSDFGNSDFPFTVIDGIRDASSHIESMAANCPKTREVLGGYSQGAAVAGYVTSAAVPPGIPAAVVPPPMPPEVASHVAAVTLFGTPSDHFLQQYGAPPIAIGPLYQPKTLELCAVGDAICGDGGSPAAHALYSVNGMAGQAADYAANHL